MSLLEQQNLLARLYTDEDFRREFWLRPEEIGGSYGLTTREIAEIRDASVEELEFFSNSLFWKRFREVEKITPLVKNETGENFERLFREFSATYNPQGTKKHLDDALEFCRFLERRESVSRRARDAAKFERTRLRFYNSDNTFAFVFLRSHPFNPDKRFCLAAWSKLGGKNRYFIR